MDLLTMEEKLAKISENGYKWQLSCGNTTQYEMVLYSRKGYDNDYVMLPQTKADDLYALINWAYVYFCEYRITL